MRLELPPPTNPCINNIINKLNLSSIKTNRICHRENLQETVYPLLEQRSAVISEFLDYICARVEGKGDLVLEGSSVFGWLWVRHAAELSPAGASVEGCVIRRLKGLHWKPLEFILNHKKDLFPSNIYI